MKKQTAYVLLGAVGLACIGGAASCVLLRPRPTRLAATARAGDDTVVVNQMHGTRLGATVLDQRGRRLRSDTAVRYQWIAGDSIPISADGALRCDRRGDAVVRASFERLSTQFVLRCRPVKWIEAATWLDFVVGDSARDLPFVVYGPDRRAVTELRGAVTVPNGSVVDISGTTVRPKRSGATVAIVNVGELEARIPIMVYQLVTSFAQALPLMAMRVSMARGDTVMVPLPRAAFWVTYLSKQQRVAPPTIEVVGEGSCTTGDGLRARRMETGEYAKYCHTGNGARLMISHGMNGAASVDGVVAVRLMW